IGHETGASSGDKSGLPHRPRLIPTAPRFTIRPNRPRSCPPLPQLLLGFLVFSISSQAGCSTLRGQQLRSPSPTATSPTNSSPTNSSSTSGKSAGVTAASAAPTTAKTIQRTSYIEERYRDEYDPLPAKQPQGLESISPENIQANLKKLSGKGRNTALARQLFVEAEELYSQASQLSGDLRGPKFAEAATKYREAAERWPNSLLEEDALFMAGEGFFFADQYPPANEMYERLVKQHPNTRHMDIVDAHRFSIAEYWLKLDKESPDHFYSVNILDQRRPWRDTRGHAFRVFDRIRVDDPTGKLSDDATLSAANAHFAAGDYFKADSLYTDLRKTFPSSEHQFLAHFFGLNSKLLCYEGPDYSGDALDQAEQLIKQIRRQFPQQAEQERKYLIDALAEIRFRKAERLWTRGRYHELRQEYRAAQFYYDQIAREYEETPFAKQAQDQIAANSNKPPVPPQTMQWLVDMFPKRETARPLFPNDEPTATSNVGKR
ncbi:MAG: tetratricopeptide repeat protein, partial [Planctomycetota bacterium]